jgi:hypothetical protein
MVSTGVEQGMRAIRKSDGPPRASGLSELLSAAASVAVAAIGAEFGAAVLAPLLELEHGAVASTLKGILKSAFHVQVSGSQVPLDDIIEAFNQEVEDQEDQAENAFILRWAGMYEVLQQLSVEELEPLRDKALRPLKEKAFESRIAVQTMIAWTNFLARAVHGGMMGWDYWESNGGKGALKLAGAADASREDPTHGNVDPSAMDWALDDTQRPMQREHFGILEIFVDTRGRVIDYMRLDHVSAAVRRELRTLGKVRDLKVNKIVRMCDPHTDPPVPIAAAFITADGYVRRTNWGAFDLVHMPHNSKNSWEAWKQDQQCFDDLIDGKESEDCHLDHAANEKNVIAFAEAAQDLPLGYLKE